MVEVVGPLGGGGAVKSEIGSVEGGLYKRTVLHIGLRCWIEREDALRLRACCWIWEARLE